MGYGACGNESFWLRTLALLHHSTRRNQESNMEEPTHGRNHARKALKIKNRLIGRLAKVQADIQAFNGYIFWPNY